MKQVNISGKTQICGIIGDPIEHTISPAMQNAAFKQSGLDFIYVPFKVNPDSLGEAVAGMRAFNIRGLNVTIPHKVAVIRYLDDLDEMARNIGAVNTLVNEDGYLKGYNTDAAGFLRALEAEKVTPAGKNIVIIGAGGASRGISFILTDKGANLTILNRNEDAARGISDRLFRIFRKEVKALELNNINLKIALEGADVLVNTTSVGMFPICDKTPVPSRLMKRDMVVFDIIYNPIKTRLLDEAGKHGAKTISGIEMLVWQGAAAFEIWTGKKAPVEVMKESAVSMLGGSGK